MIDLNSFESAPFIRRRERLADLLGGSAAVIAAGAPQSRNFPANTYPFRATSHFLYLVGAAIPGAFVEYHAGQWTLFAPEHGPDHALWHGATPTLSDLGAVLHLPTKPIAELSTHVERGAGSLPVADTPTLTALRDVLGRPRFGLDPSEGDRKLTSAMVEARIRHDAHGLGEIRSAVAATASAFAAGRDAMAPGRREWEVKAAMVGAVAAQGMGVSFNPIVSVHGEILHNETSHGVMSDGEMLLVDFGAEASSGWAADVTRTWPVGGSYSARQKEMIDVVLAAQRAGIARCTSGTRYRDVHLAAARQMASGLVDLGVLRGDVDELVADGVVAILFPHGIGHLMGLDVHDMEDLGDAAGYPSERERSAQFGLNALRLDRDLEAGMVVTVEPGIYLVPAILNDPELSKIAGDRLDRDVLARFSDVRGIRIEDDILVRPDGEAPEVLTAAIPKPTI